MAIDLEKLREDFEKLNKKSGSINNLENYFQAKEGSNYIRFLPSRDMDREPWYTKTIYHRFNDKDGKLVTMQCRKVIGEECPIDNFYYHLWEEHNRICEANSLKTKGEDRARTPYSKWAGKLKGQDRFFANVVDRETNDVKIFSIPPKLMSNIMSNILGEFGDIVDLQTGRDY